MANDHFYCVFLNNEKISEQISWRIDTCPQRLDQQTQSFMDQFTYFRLFLDFCHLSCTSWNFIRPLPPTFQDSACDVHFVSTFSLSLLPAETLLISITIYLSCIFHLHTHAKLTFFSRYYPSGALIPENFQNTHTYTSTSGGPPKAKTTPSLPADLPPLSLLNLLSALSLLLFPPPLSVPSLSQFFHFPWLHFTTLPRLEETALVIFSLSHLWMFIRLEDFSKCMGSKANAVFLHSFVLGSRFLGEIFQLQRICVFLDAKVSNKLSAR